MNLKIFWTAAFFLSAFNPAFPGKDSNDCFVVDYATDVRVAQGKLIQERTIVIQINNQQADWISDIEISYYKNDDLDITEAVILNKNDQVERKLRKAEITTRSDVSHGTFYHDRMIKEFKLQWHQYPYRIRYSYKITSGQFMYIANWSPVLYLDVPVLNASLDVQLLRNYEVLIHSTDSLVLKLSETDEVKKYSWKSSYLEQIVKESNSPSLQERLQRVMMVPKTFLFEESGSFSSWAGFGDWQYRIIKDKDELLLSEKQKVDALIAGIEDEYEIIRKLYKYMQDNTRYINIAIDEGGLVPYPASYVCQNKYGDCKALTIYMKALLKYAGIKSYYTLIYADSNPRKINVDFPSQQFNHVILCVPVKEDTVWLENTSKVVPFNYLGTYTQNRYGLLIDEKDSRLVRTPALALDDVKEESYYEFTLNERGTGILKIDRKLQGEEFEKYRSIDISLNDRDKREVVKRSAPVKKNELVGFEIGNYDDYKAKLDFRASFEVYEQFKHFGATKVIQPFPMVSHDLESEESRKSDVRINYPINRSDSIVYILPFIERMDVKLPENVQLETKFGNYYEQYAKTGNMIIAHRDFQLYRGEYDIKEYPDFKSFLKSVENTQTKSNIVLNSH
jgi:hypothetical protein